MFPMYISKTAAARILNVKFNAIKEIRVYNGKILVRYTMNKGNCATFISYNAFKKDFLELRINAHIKHSYSLLDLSTLNNLEHIQVTVKYETSHDTHLVELIGGEYSCDCEDFRKQVEIGNGFCKSVCKHLVPIAKHYGFTSFAELVKANKRVASKVKA